MHQYGHRLHAPLLRLPLLFQIPPDGESFRLSAGPHTVTLSQQQIAACALFLAAKVEEQPRKLEHVIRVAQMIHKTPNFDVNHEVGPLVRTI